MRHLEERLLIQGISFSGTMWTTVTVVVTPEFLEETEENTDSLVESLMRGDEILVVIDEPVAHVSKDILRKRFPKLFESARKRAIHLDAVRAGGLSREVRAKPAGFSLVKKDGSQRPVLARDVFSNIAFDETTLRGRPLDRKFLFTALRKFALLSLKERDDAYQALGLKPERPYWVVNESVVALAAQLEKELSAKYETARAA